MLLLLPSIPIASAVDFILPVCAGSRQLLGRAAVDRRQLTGKMKSTALGKNTTGTASSRRTIVTMTVISSCVSHPRQPEINGDRQTVTEDTGLTAFSIGPG